MLKGSLTLIFKYRKGIAEFGLSIMFNWAFSSCLIVVVDYYFFFPFSYYYYYYHRGVVLGTRFSLQV